MNLADVPTTILHLLLITIVAAVPLAISLKLATRIICRFTLPYDEAYNLSLLVFFSSGLIYLFLPSLLTPYVSQEIMARKNIIIPVLIFFLTAGVYGNAVKTNDKFRLGFWKGVVVALLQLPIALVLGAVVFVLLMFLKPLLMALLERGKSLLH